MPLEETPTEPARPARSRLNASFQELLTQNPASKYVARSAINLTLPKPVYPRDWRSNGSPNSSGVTLPMISRAMRGWLAP